MCMKQALKYLPSYIPLNGTSPFSQTWMGGSFNSFELITKYISGLGIAKINPNYWHLGFFEGQYQCGLNQCHMEFGRF